MIRTYPKIALLSIVKSMSSVLVILTCTLQVQNRIEACFLTEFKDVKMINGEQKHGKNCCGAFKIPKHLFLKRLLKTDILIKIEILGLNAH